LLSACAAPYQYKQSLPDLQQDEIYTPFRVSPAEAAYNTPYPDIASVRFVMLLTDSNVDKPGYEHLMRTGLLSVGFKEVLDEAEGTARLQAIGVSAAAARSMDAESIRRATELLGPFLIVDSRTYRRGSNNWYSSLTVVDPASTRVLLRHELVGFGATSGVEAELIYPMLNLLNTWYQS
jgi:hypothetical protein